MNLVLPINIWPISDLLRHAAQVRRARAAEARKVRLLTARGGLEGLGAREVERPVFRAVLQEVRNRPNIDWQDQIHRGILRGLGNNSEAP